MSLEYVNLTPNLLRKSLKRKSVQTSGDNEGPNPMASCYCHWCPVATGASWDGLLLLPPVSSHLSPLAENSLS